ncbi:MAG: inorganic diphosphatase [Candidatus Baltobacteraceae bacterium]
MTSSAIEQIPPFPGKPDDDHLVNIVVETPRGVRHKYALDAASGLFKLKTTIPEGLQWPYDYGFVPGTKGADGDPVDILFLDDAPTFPGCLLEARLLGIVRLEKNGERNDRLVACAKRVEGVAQTTDPYERLADLPETSINSLCRFLVEYSAEAGNTIVFKGIDGRKKALAAIREGIERFR